MRVLLDESLPRQLAPEIEGHDCRTVRNQRWSGVKNGALLALAREEGFEAFITADRSIEYQQSEASRAELLIVVLRTFRNRMQDLLPLVPQILTVLENEMQGTIVTIMDPRMRKK